MRAFYVLVLCALTLLASCGGSKKEEPKKDDEVKITVTFHKKNLQEKLLALRQFEQKLLAAAKGAKSEMLNELMQIIHGVHEKLVKLKAMQVVSHDAAKTASSACVGGQDIWLPQDQLKAEITRLFTSKGVVLPETAGEVRLTKISEEIVAYTTISADSEAEPLTTTVDRYCFDFKNPEPMRQHVKVVNGQVQK